MLIAAGRVDLRLQARSLKEKRRVIRSLKDRAQTRLQMRVAEVEGQDTWQRAVLGFALVGSDRRHLESLCDRGCELLTSSSETMVVSVSREVLHFGDSILQDGTL